MIIATGSTRHRTFRVALVGTHSTGKTTLLKELARRSSTLRIATIGEIARRLIAEGFPMGKNTVVDSWVKFIDEQLRRERELSPENFDLLISDRTILDAAAYASVNRRLPRPYIPDYFVSMVRELAIRAAEYYDLFAYCPIEFPMSADGIRDEDEAYREAVDVAMRQLLEEAGLDFVVLTGSVDDRAHTLIDRLPRPLQATLRGMTRVEVVPENVTEFPEPTETDADELALREAGFGDVIDSALFSRLGGVSFLGVLDHVYGIATPSNRREHSLAAAAIALRVAERLRLSASSTETFVLANLLHDVGHGPFSHNSEPFLSEARHVYHHGLLTTYLRHGPANIGEQYSVANLLKKRGAEQREATSALLMKKSEGVAKEAFLLFTSPLNCDKIDGNYRTAVLLKRQGLSPLVIESLFERRGDVIVIPESGLDVIEEFWNVEASLYWDAIYTSGVFAAEAMLTRALTYVFDSDEKITSFALSTDEQVLDRLNRHGGAAHLIARLQNNVLFQPLSELNAELFARARGRLTGARFDRVTRTAIEREVADELGIEPAAVISHFSRRKHFASDVSGLRQRSLFREHLDALPLDEIAAHLSSSKVPGDMIEVFCDVA